MHLKPYEWFLAIGTAFYVLGFGVFYLLQGNYEFLWYVAVLLFFFGLIIVTFKKARFDNLILSGLSLWGLLHMAGGGIRVGGDVLYAYVLIPLIERGDLIILRYDQVVHFFGFLVATLVSYHLLRPYLHFEKVNRKVLYPLLVATGAGLGAFNEIVEFIAVLSISETHVGGYYNTALDLVFNTLGAMAAVLIIHFREKR